MPRIRITAIVDDIDPTLVDPDAVAEAIGLEDNHPAWCEIAGKEYVVTGDGAEWVDE